MSNISLLVDCHKIITWLQDRKKLKKDWYTYLKAADEKIKILLKSREWALQHTKIHDYITQNQSNFHYTDVCQVVTFLLETNLSQSNIIFGYSNPIMKEWAALKKYMDNQSNSLGLLSIAKFIQQALKFDLPAQNKSIENIDTQLSTLRRKIDYNNNTIFQQSKEILKEKALLGIQEGSHNGNASDKNPENIEDLIKNIIKNGPQQIIKFQSICKSQEIKKYVTLYKTFHVENPLLISDLDLLTYFIEHGNDFFQIYKTKNEQLRSQYDQKQKYQSYQSWRAVNEWQIIIQEVKNVSISQSTSSQRKVNNLDTKTLLEDKNIRNGLINNLNQLLFFFKGVKYELMNAGKGLGFQSQNYKSISMVQGQAQTAISSIQNCLSFLNSKQLIAPLELKNSKKAYQVLINHFGGFQANIKTMRQQIVTYKSQIVQLQVLRAKEIQGLHFLRKKIVASKKNCQVMLSDLIKKEVKITGQINKLQ